MHRNVEEEKEADGIKVGKGRNKILLLRLRLTEHTYAHEKVNENKRTAREERLYKEKGPEAHPPQKTTAFVRALKPRSVITLPLLK